MLPRSWFRLGLILYIYNMYRVRGRFTGEGFLELQCSTVRPQRSDSFSPHWGVLLCLSKGRRPRSAFPGLFVPDGVRKICPVFFWGWEGKGKGTIHFSSFPWPSWLSKGNHENAAVNLDPRSSDSFPPQDTRGREWREEIYQILWPSNPSCGVASVWLKLFSITRGGLALKMQLVLKEKPQLAANNNRGILCWMGHLFCGYTQSNFCKEKGLVSVGYSIIWKRTDH